MPLPELILGSLPALEAELIEDVARWRSRDPLVKLTILIGNPLLRPYLRRTISEQLGGSVNLRLRTIGELALDLGEASLLAAGRQPLPPLGERIICEQIAGQAPGYLEPVAGTPGLTSALDRLLRELRGAGVQAYDLQDAAGQAVAEQVNSIKLEALAALQQRHERRRARFYGPEDCIQSADLARLDSACLLVYGLWSLTSIERELLASIAGRVPTRIFLPTFDVDSDDAHRELRRWLETLGANQRRLDSPEPDATTLDHLQRNLFQATTAPVLDGRVRLLSAPDPPREVREAARTCLRWAEEGIPFHEMAISFRHPGSYESLIDEIFDEAGIPRYLHGGRSLAGQPLGRRVGALLGLIGSRLRRAEVMEFLTDTTLPDSTREIYGEIEPSTWDALSREAGIVEGREQWQIRLRLLALAKERESFGGDDEPSPRLQVQLIEIERLSKFIDDLAERLEVHPGQATWREHIDFFANLMQHYVASSEPVCTALENMLLLRTLTEQVSFERFRRAARLALQQMESSETLGQPAELFGQSGVAVLPVEALRQLRFRAVALLGLAERSFPAPPRQDPLLLDHERQALNERFGWTLPLRALGPDPEPLRFVMAVQAARERLHLSYARGAAGASRPYLPSHFFRAAAEALVGERVGVEQTDSLPAAIFQRIRAGQFTAPKLHHALSPAEYDRTLLAADPNLGLAYLSDRSASFVRARAAWQARHEHDVLTEWDGLLGEDLQRDVERLARLGTAISPTRLEMYATCPYRFFLRHLLRLTPVEEPELLERLEALERGSLVHEILQRFLTECGPNDSPSADRSERHLGRLLAIAAEAFAEREERGLVGFPLLWENDHLTIIDDLRTWYEHEVSDSREHRLRPGAFELRFGRSWGSDTGSELSIDQPYEFPVDGRTLRFEGRIDRVDWPTDGPRFRVIDYKTGAARAKADTLAGGKALQLPIYLLATAGVLQHSLGREFDWKQSEAQYFYVSQRGQFKRVAFNGQTLARRWDDFVELVKDLAESIASGDFHAEPGRGAEHCRYCDYQELCDIRIDRIAARKAGSRPPRFIRLTEVE